MKKITLLMLAICLSASARAQKHEQEFVRSDLDNFWAAYDQITSTKDTFLQKESINCPRPSGTPASLAAFYTTST